MITRRTLALSLLVSLAATALSADVSILERQKLHARPSPAKADHGRRPTLHKRTTGSQVLVDAQGLQYFINTDITFSTSIQASGAASEASFSHAVNATTSGGGTTASSLNDAFDGYNNLCLSFDNSVAPCEVDNENFAIYSNNGQVTTECLGPVSGVNRQVVFNPQDIGNIRVQRKVFVPDNDQFARWLNIFTNTGGSPQTVTAVISNDLGSDNNTVVVTSSNGNASAEPTDSWVTTFQNYSGNTSTDPRLGHVVQGPGAVTPLAGIHFANGDQNPYWGYTFTLNPGQTKIIANYVTGQPSKAAAAAKSAQIAGLPDTALQCLSSAERAEIVNFALPQPIPALGQTGLIALGVLLATIGLIVLRRM